MFGGALGPDLFSGLQKLLSWQGGPVNWDLATQVATTAAGTDDPAVTDADRAAVVEAVRLADHWLDPVTTLPASSGDARTWTRLQWVEQTLPAWKQLVEPVASRVVAAMGGALEKGMQGLMGGGAIPGLPEGIGPEMIAGMLGGGQMKQMMDQVGGLVFGAQVGQALGALAGEVLGATEIGLPLSDGAALLPANVAAFTDGLEVDAGEVRLYLALREAAHQRLFAHVPWLRAHLYDAVDAYARGIEVDPAAIDQAISSIDPSDMESLQSALSQGVFEMKPTPSQQAALDRLETALALVEGWVDAVVEAAAAERLPSSVALRETVRRRRASGGPAEQTFATLVGLQLRPRRLREAASLWAAVAQAKGIEGRDALWEHPDLLPGPTDLEDVLGFLDRTGATPDESGTDWDAALRDLADGDPDSDAADPDSDPDADGT
ncbi:MAG: zinc-dependent metalloprotease [Mycobacteriales bacterium]|nr:zinc-dependent metalloprotease [Mycobacteriales bacterium]